MEVPYCRHAETPPAFALTTEISCLVTGARFQLPQAVPRVNVRCVVVVVSVSPIASGAIGSIQQQLPKYPRKALNVTLILPANFRLHSYVCLKGRFPPLLVRSRTR